MFHISRQIKMMKEIKLIRKLIDLLIYFMFHKCHMSDECKSMRRLCHYLIMCQIRCYSDDKAQSNISIFHILLRKKFSWNRIFLELAKKVIQSMKPSAVPSGKGFNNLEKQSVVESFALTVVDSTDQLCFNRCEKSFASCLLCFHGFK